MRTDIENATGLAKPHMNYHLWKCPACGWANKKGTTIYYSLNTECRGACKSCPRQVRNVFKHLLANADTDGTHSLEQIKWLIAQLNTTPQEGS